MSGVIVITGPTGAGKTELVLALAERVDVRLISMDSAQVYRGLDIGSAKLDRDTLQRYPHALVDVRDPEETYSVAEFVADAKALIHEAWAHNAWPVLVGGTTLYLKALLYGLDALPSADAALRAKIGEQAKQIGWQGLHAKLMGIDPALEKTIGPTDRQRIQRALEIYALSGKPPSELMSANKVPLFNACRIVVTPSDRAHLHQRIEERFAQMLDQGLIEEVAELMSRPHLTAEHAAMKSVGYRQVWTHLATGSGDLDALRAEAIAATRQLAKRQLTALRKLNKALWYDALSPKLVDQVSRQVEGFTHSLKAH